MDHKHRQRLCFGKFVLVVLGFKQKPSRQKDPAEIAEDVGSTHTLQNPEQGGDRCTAP